MNEQLLYGHHIYPILINLLYNVYTYYKYFRKFIIIMVPQK